MSKDSNKKMLLEMMHKVGGMPLNENYPMGAEPEYAGDDAPYNQDDEYENNEPDPDEGRDDDMSENDDMKPNNYSSEEKSQNIIADEFHKKIRDLVDWYIIGYGQPSTQPDLTLNKDRGIKIINDIVGYIEHELDTPNRGGEVHGY